MSKVLSIRFLLELPATILSWVVDFCVRELTEPRKIYHPGEVSNLRALKRRLKEGDVLLVCGNARISYVVKVLTMSAWSHVVLYVGDRQDLLTPEEIEEWTKRYGASSLKHLVIDADPVRRVHLKPLEEYVGLMIRLCRATALTEVDRRTVINTALSQLGRQYDIKHIMRLLVFFCFSLGDLASTIAETHNRLHLIRRRSNLLSSSV